MPWKFGDNFMVAASAGANQAAVRNLLPRGKRVRWLR
jgi:hypothetical protein